MIDVQKLARDAGFEVHERKQEVRVGIDALIGIDSTAKLERFAALVLEEVANKFDQPHMEYFGQEIQDYIRSLKPKGD